MSFEKFLFDVLVGLCVAALSLAAKWQWPLIRGLFDAESRRQAAQLTGSWDATEHFSGSGTQNTYSMVLSCRGGVVTGTHTCLSGPDQGRVFELQGSYKDLILTFAWFPSSREALESGTVTAKLVQDGVLAGHGLYIEPGDGKVYTSTYSARRK